jgi:Uncharacterised nucleotidyltransferase
MYRGGRVVGVRYSLLTRGDSPSWCDLPVPMGVILDVKMEAHHSVEQKLLLALLGRRMEALDNAAMFSLLRQVNWANFLNTTSEDLYPYLAFGLEPYLSFLEASPELERLFKARRITAVHNLLLRHELGKTLEALQGNGIPALALKGIVLAYTAYPDLSLRPMSDLDLLVPPGKREEAVLMLRTLGYEYPEDVLTMHANPNRRLSQVKEFAPSLRLRASTVLVEVHCQLECSEPMFPMPLEEFWSRSILLDLKGLTVRTLCPEDFLFHLSLHQSCWHRFNKGLLPLVDLKLLLDSRRDWNWAGIAERSLRCGCATWMYLTLEVARDFVGAPVPDSFFQALPRPRNLPLLRSVAEEQIWSAQCGQSATPGFLPSLLAEGSWRSRARMFVTYILLLRQQEIGSEPGTASLIRRTRLSLRLLTAALRKKIPRYFYAWKSGRLNLRTIRRNAALLRSSNALFELIDQEIRCSDQNFLAESTSRAP